MKKPTHKKPRERALTDEQAKTLAMDIRAGDVFTSRAIQPHDMELLPVIFMPLALMDRKMASALAKDAPVLIFERMSKAGPRSINDYPIFMSAQMLWRADAEKVSEYIKKLEAARGGD